MADVSKIRAITDKLAVIDPYGLRPGADGGPPRNEYDLEARDLAEHLDREGSITSQTVDSVWQRWFQETLTARIGAEPVQRLVDYLNSLVSGGDARTARGAY